MASDDGLMRLITITVEGELIEDGNNENGCFAHA
jgi:hypothetical protein